MIYPVQKNIFGTRDGSYDILLSRKACNFDSHFAIADTYRESIRYVLDNCPEDMEFFDKFVQKGIINRLETVTRDPFKRLSYTSAVKMLEESGENFDYEVKWGNDLQSEHERFLVEKMFNGCPLVITDYPKSCKVSISFLLNETLATMRPTL